MIIRIIFVIMIFFPSSLFSQGERLNKKLFFEADTTIPSLYLSAGLKNISSKKQKEDRRPAFVRLLMSDSIERKGTIEIRARGKFRFENCYPPPLMLHFNAPEAASVGGLGKLKMVWGCEDGTDYDQLVLKEFLAYKLYEQLTSYSLRVRRLNVFYSDSARVNKWYKKQAFLIEDIEDMAKRVKYRESKGQQVYAVETNKEQYLLMAIFQYMIGNADWGISAGHNIEFLVPKDSVSGTPIAIPFDFDFSGLVNAPYAMPPENFPIESVQERFYMGVILDKTLLEKCIDHFLEKKPDLFSVIYDCHGLTETTRAEVVKYISEFYSIIANRELALSIFLNPKEVKPR